MRTVFSPHVELIFHWNELPELLCKMVGADAPWTHALEFPWKKSGQLTCQEPATSQSSVLVSSLGDFVIAVLLTYVSRVPDQWS